MFADKHTVDRPKIITKLYENRITNNLGTDNGSKHFE